MKNLRGAPEKKKVDKTKARDEDGKTGARLL